MTASTTDQRWQAGRHQLTFDPSGEPGRQIVDLYTQLMQSAGGSTAWNGGDVVTIVNNWLTGLGFLEDAPAPTLAKPGHVFVPYSGGVVLGSAHRSPWLADSYEQATLPVGERPDVTPVFCDLEPARRWIRWFVANYPLVGRTVDNWEIREVPVKFVSHSEQPWKKVFPRNGADWSYQTSATRYPVTPPREDLDD